MKASKLVVGLIGGIATIMASSAVYAENFPKNYGYMTDVKGDVVKNSYGQCWRTGYWTEAMAIAECDSSLAQKVESKPAPVAAAVAAPAAAPAPAPKPVEKAKTVIVEKPVRLEGASFATGSSKLLPGASSKLDEVVNAANQSQDIKLNVMGYTDSKGNAQSNLRLSQGRADAVKAYLVKKGVAADRISSKGFGSANPIADNATAEGRSANRRVEVQYAIKEEQKVQ